MMALLYSRVVFRPLLARRALFSPFLPPSRISAGPYQVTLFLGDPTHSAALINESSSMHHRPFMIYFLLNFCPQFSIHTGRLHLSFYFHSSFFPPVFSWPKIPVSNKRDNTLSW
ncbi:hypothetical protein BJV77DRAFT_1007505 [Russula vinacea]|nr:hypothetical protein BJV77DRAFT_1007505 [Russula vinacea]